MRKILIASDHNYRRYAEMLANRLLRIVGSEIDIVYAGPVPLNNNKVIHYDISEFQRTNLHHFNSSNWWRWFAISHILEANEKDEILYLDIDIIVRGAFVITDLFDEVPIDGFLIALDRVGNEHGKFNTGVFVCKGKEALRVSKALAQLSGDDQFIHDQVAFNVVMDQKKVTILDERYNVQLFPKEKNRQKDWKIIHCIGPTKQWTIRHSQYLKYLLYK